MKASFDAFDADGSGCISTGELKNVLNHLDVDANDNELKEMLTSLDKNHDGTITFAGKIFCYLNNRVKNILNTANPLLFILKIVC